MPKVGNREGAGVEWDGIEGGGFGSSSLEVHIVSYGDVTNILSDLLLILLVDEHERVMLGIAPIVKHPFLSRVLCLVFVATDRDVRRGGGGSGHALEERRRLIPWHDNVGEVRFDEVRERQDICEVCDGVVFFDGDG
jgi:hypothetical protein